MAWLGLDTVVVLSLWGPSIDNMFNAANQCHTKPKPNLNRSNKNIVSLLSFSLFFLFFKLI